MWSILRGVYLEIEIHMGMYPLRQRLGDAYGSNDVLEAFEGYRIKFIGHDETIKVTRSIVNAGFSARKKRWKLSWTVDLQIICRTKVI